ncbi:MAG: DUF5615 family PIN-like protein [Cyanobacteria bacterium P01_F01_bin.150]
MTEICLYLDEDATSNRLLRSLRSRGANVLSTVEADMLSQPDEKQLEWALANRRVIYSFNVRDFYRLHTEWLTEEKQHAGIILSKQSLSIGDQVKGLLKLIATKSAEELESQVEFLSAWINQ